MPEKLLKIITEILRTAFTGCIEIHCFKGIPSSIKHKTERKEKQPDGNLVTTQYITEIKL